MTRSDLTEAQLAALLAIAGQDRPVSERELWVPRERVEYDHGPSVVADVIGLGLAVEWLHPDGPQLVPTEAGAAVLGVVIDEQIDLRAVNDADDEGQAVRYEVILKRDAWVEPPAYLAEAERKRRRWPFRLPKRKSMHPIPDPHLVTDRRKGPLEELIDLEAWSSLLGTRVGVDADGRMVAVPGPAPEGASAPTGAEPIRILGAEVRAGRGPRRSA